MIDVYDENDKKGGRVTYFRIRYDDELNRDRDANQMKVWVFFYQTKK